jgi:hypothetical protein
MHVLTIKVEEADSLAAVKLDRMRPKRWARKLPGLRYWLRAAFWIVVLVFLFVLFGPSTSSPENKAGSFGSGLFVGVCGTLLVLLLVGVYLRYVEQPRVTKRVYRRSKSLQEPTRVEWSDEGLVFENAQHWEKLNWADVLKWKEGEGLFLLYRAADQRYFIVPQRCFPDVEALASFRSALQTHVPG